MVRVCISVCCLVLATGMPTLAKRVQLQVGDHAPEWKDLMGVDGKRHALAELKDQKAVVIVFTSTHCPFAQASHPKLKRLDDLFRSKGVAIVAINSNKGESLRDMKADLKRHKLEVRYLSDDKQTMAKNFGAMMTPQVFLLKSDRTIAYLGAIDDARSPTGKAKKHYLQEAIEAVLADKKPPLPQTRPIGCTIRWK